MEDDFMKLGIPKEIMKNENRVAAVPETVAKYISMGFEVLVESKAGEGIYVSDEEYSKAGAKVVTDVEELFGNSDIIIKVKEPLFNKTKNKHEIEMFKDGSILITFLHPAAPGNFDNVKKLQEHNITAFTMDGIPRIPRAQKMDALTSMSTITGYKSVVIAANNLPTIIPMVGTAIGVIKPANFLFIGVGVVGLQGIATAKRLGGVIRPLDIRNEAKTEASSLGAKIVDFDIPQEIAIGHGGYANSIPDEWLLKEREIISRQLPDIDVIILSALVPGEVAPQLITEEMVQTMKNGSVIIDVAIDQGGNCVITEPGSIINVHNVIICGIKNIPGSVPVHSTWLYAHNILHFIELLFKDGLKKVNFDDDIIKHTLVTHKGKLLHEGTIKAQSKLKRT
jgi:NAD(P) transhydrogenase subunit alpha